MYHIHVQIVYFLYSEEWKPTIGLEIHAQILTKSKLFSGAPTNFNNPINSCVSFFDCAIPGTMPVKYNKYFCKIIH